MLLTADFITGLSAAFLKTGFLGTKFLNILENSLQSSDEIIKTYASGFIMFL